MSMIIIEGAHLTRDPQRHEGRNGDFLTFGVAENHRRKDADGEWQDDGATFYDITVGGGTNLVDNIEASLSKGDKVDIFGHLKAREWEDQNGNTRTSFSVRANTVSPSLHWATAVPDRNEKRSGGGGRGGPPPEDDF